MWARFTVLNDTPIASAIAGCVIPLSRSNTIWMRWRCAAGIFHRNAVFNFRIWLLLHLTIGSSKSAVKANHTPTPECNSLRCSVPCCYRKPSNSIRFWKRYQSVEKPIERAILFQFVTSLLNSSMASVGLVVITLNPTDRSFCGTSAAFSAPLISALSRTTTVSGVRAAERTRW